MKVFVEHTDSGVMVELGEFTANEIDPLVSTFHKYGASMDVKSDWTRCNSITAEYRPNEKAFVIMVETEE